MRDDLKGRTRHDLAPRVLESSFMAKAVWCHVRKGRVLWAAGNQFQEWLDCTACFCVGCLNEHWQGCGGVCDCVYVCVCVCAHVRREGGGGISKRVPTVSLTVWFECRQTLKWTLRKVRQFCEMQVLSLPLNAVKHRGRSCTKPYVLNKLSLLYQDWQSRGTLI